MKSLYQVDIHVTATAYIRADSRLDALTKAKALHGDCLNVAEPAESEVAISDLPFNHPALPEVSLSPVMTVWSANPATIQIAEDNANRAEAIDG